VERGIVKVGEELRSWLEADLEDGVHGGGDVQEAPGRGAGGGHIGVLLRGTKREEVERGQVLSKPASITPHTKFECEVYVLSKEEGGRHTPSSRGTGRSSTSAPPT